MARRRLANYLLLSTRWCVHQDGRRQLDRKCVIKDGRAASVETPPLIWISTEDTVDVLASLGSAIRVERTDHRSPGTRLSYPV